MFGSSILEVAIGLVLVYLLLSLICSALQESLEAWFKIRASNLELGMREILCDADGTRLTKDIYTHPLIFGSFRGGYDPTKVRSNSTTNLPTYIPAANFATALLDTVVRGPVNKGLAQGAPAQELNFESLQMAVVNSTTLDASLQRVLLLALDSSQGDLTKVQANVEAWFNNGMDRVSGWYKRRMQLVILGLGLAVAIVLNVDSLKVAGELYRNDALRAGAVAQAGVVMDTGAEKPDLTNTAIDMLGQLNLPIGWADKSDAGEEATITDLFWTVVCRFPGWLITAIAISFGAPFWFDMLNKFTVIRSTIKPLRDNPKGSRNCDDSESKDQH